MQHISKIGPSFIIQKEKLGPKEKEVAAYTLADVPQVEGNSSIRSKFNFLRAHNGYQKGHIHLLLGRTNKGKSTLIFSLIAEAILNGNRCLLYVSEGLKEEIRASIEAIIRLKHKEEVKKILSLVAFANDQSSFLQGHSIPEHWVDALFNYAGRSKAQIVFFDNFSTSPYGDASPEIQARFFKRVKERVETSKLPLFGAVHPTKSASPTKTLELADVRANSAFSTLPSLVYGFNDLSNGTRILEIIKSRKDGKINHTYYELNFKDLVSGGYYNKDKQIPANSAVKLLRQSNWQKPTTRN